MMPLNNIVEVFDLLPMPYISLKQEAGDYRIIAANAAYIKLISNASGLSSEMLKDNLPLNDIKFKQALYNALDGVNSNFKTQCLEFSAEKINYEIHITHSGDGLLLGIIQHPKTSYETPTSLHYQLFDNLLEGCQAIDFDWKYIYVNDSAAFQGRHQKETYSGQYFFDLYPQVKGSNLHKLMEKVMHERILQQTENEFTYEDNSKAWFELSIYPSADGIFILSLDITERKKAQQELRTREHQLKRFSEQSVDLISILSKDLKQIYRSRSAFIHTGWTDEEMQQISIQSLIHKDDAHLVQEAMNMCVAFAGKSIPVSFRALHRKGYYISLEGTIVNYLDDEFINGYVITVRDVSERKKSEQWSQKNEKELRQAQEITRLGYIHFDLTGDNSFGSEEMHNIWETDNKSAPLSLDNFLNTIHTDDKKRFEEFLLKLFAGFSNHEIEYRILVASGKVKHIFQRTELERNSQGEIIALNCMLLNITATRQAEIALQESDEKFRQLFNSSPLPQWLFDSQTLFFIDVNEAAIKNYGYSREEFLNMTIEDIRQPEEVERLLKTRENIKKSKSDFKDRSFVHLKKNGDIINVDIKSSHVVINGRDARVVIARDITAELAFEKQLIESNERYNLVLEATNESIIDWDIEKDTTIWGKGFEKNFGYNLSKYDNHLWSRNIHENDRNRVLNDLDITLQNPGKRYFEAEFAYVKADGEIAHVQHRGIILRNSMGKPIRAIGAMIDLTELKEKISEIERHNQNLKNIAWTQSHIVRAPLARMLGLIKLIENKHVSTTDFNELSKILTLIVTSAYELDDIIKEIVKKTTPNNNELQNIADR